ncbi:MAG: helix-turn-helix transcriptional regulator [Candidatus Rokubacteria bacterium]|nr:helix-turn-helix transcriptional regulator [Candidatus Rokubacteria bacterium]
MMTGAVLKAERHARGWSQAQAAARLGLTQPHLSMLESGRRRVTRGLAKRVFEAYNMSPASVAPTGVPTYATNPSEALARDLAALGYPGFAYLRSDSQWEPKNPAQVLLAALMQDDLDPRVVEALPWLVARYAPVDDDWLVREAKLRDLQNRLGFVVALARRLCERSNATEKADVLRRLEAQLDRSRLAREDTLCRRVGASLRRRLVEHRSEDARHWNLLTDWTVDALRYAA